jgi:hypothetical protein
MSPQRPKAQSNAKFKGIISLRTLGLCGLKKRNGPNLNRVKRDANLAVLK